MTQKQILYFEKAYETRNISTAADALYVSRSVISRSIQELEEEFGVPLFDRSKAGIEPTEAGNLLHGMVLQVTGCYDALVNRLHHIGETTRQRTLCVAVTPTNNRVLCRLLYGPFHEAFPDIRIRVYERYSDDSLELLTSGAVDLIVSPAVDMSIMPMDYVDLYKVQIVVGVSKDHPLANREILSVVDLIDLPLGFLGNPIAAVEKNIQAAFSRQNAQPNTMLLTSDVLVLEELTQNGQIISILPDDMMASWDNVVTIPMDFMQRRSTHRICWNKLIPLNSAANDFINFTKEYFSTHTAQELLRSIRRQDVAEKKIKGVPDFSANLSESFYADLLNLPSCKSRGYCDNCGRCEH